MYISLWILIPAAIVIFLGVRECMAAQRNMEKYHADNYLLREQIEAYKESDRKAYWYRRRSFLATSHIRSLLIKKMNQEPENTALMDIYEEFSVADGWIDEDEINPDEHQAPWDVK
ncbi:TPA: hypothetical protein ACGQ50_000806 [Enterobacter cloacae]